MADPSLVIDEQRSSPPVIDVLFFRGFEMRVIRPLDSLDFDRSRPSVFLAGSIEQGRAEDWQSIVVRSLAKTEITILNPRRETWDETWPQQKEFAPFREQVEWELQAQEKADLVAFYFVPETRAPVTLLELGLAAGRRRAVVCCPEGYWRKGNVEIVCARYGMKQVSTLDDLVDCIHSTDRWGEAAFSLPRSTPTRGG